MVPTTEEQCPEQELVRRLSRGVFLGVGCSVILCAIYGFFTAPRGGKVAIMDALGNATYCGLFGVFIGLALGPLVGLYSFFTRSATSRPDTTPDVPPSHQGEPRTTA